MRKKLIFILAFTVMISGFGNFANAAKKKKEPINKWNAANEFYFILPFPQKLSFQNSNDEKTVHPWGLGLRSVGNNGERFSGTGGLQLQSVRVGDSQAESSFYVVDLLLGAEYMTPKAANKPMRYTASALGGFGMSGGNYFMTSIISAGFLYTTEENAATPTGLTFNLFYRLTETNPDNGGRLKPCLGVKLGYVFKGFWAAE